MQISTGLIHIGLSLCLAFPAAAVPQSHPVKPHGTSAAAARHAEGNFDVTPSPLTSDDATTGTSIGRFLLQKRYHGGLDATSIGEMLAAGNPATGTAGYVAIEEVSGTLGGKKGSFALQHNGAMDHGKLELSVKVVPGSGTGQLANISGTMIIVNNAGKHSYQFVYTLPSGK